MQILVYEHSFEISNHILNCSKSGKLHWSQLSFMPVYPKLGSLYLHLTLILLLKYCWYSSNYIMRNFKTIQKVNKPSKGSRVPEESNFLNITSSEWVLLYYE